MKGEHMKTVCLLILTLLLASCATKPGQGFLDPMMDSISDGHARSGDAGFQAGQAATQAGNAAMDAGNAASMHQMHHTPPPAGF